MKTFAITALGILTTFTAVTETRAADRHLDDLAFDLQNQTATLVREVRYGYRHHPEFTHLYEDVVEMYQLAERVHDIAHRRVSATHLAKAVNELDELFHHVEEVLEQVDRTGAFRINRFHQQRALRVMALIEVTLHHLQDDLTPVPTGRAIPVPVKPVPVLPAPGVIRTQPIIRTPGYRVQPFRGARTGFTYNGRNARVVVNFGH